MKRFLALACFAVVTSLLAGDAGYGTPPQPGGDSQRYQVVPGMIDHGNGPEPTFMRLDTWTGAAWAVHNQPMGTEPSHGQIPYWKPISEVDGIMVKAGRETTRK